MSEITPETIALWGYGLFGKRTSESMKRYWGGTYFVTKIYDIEKRGRDPWWNIEISDPDGIAEDYLAGSFTKVMICIQNPWIRAKVKNSLKTLTIPWFCPGNKDDIISAEQFKNSEDCSLKIKGNDYSFFWLKNMRGAVSDHDGSELMHLFNEEGLIPKESIQQFDSMEPDRAVMIPFRQKQAIPDRVKLDGPFCVMARLYSQNYWHFTFQNADCVSLLEDAGYQGKYIVAGTENNLALLHLLGINDDRIVNIRDLENHKVYVFDKLALISFNGLELDYSLSAITDISRKVKRQLERLDEAPKKLYVKRIGVRKLLYVEEIVKELGFEIFIPEEHTVKEQAEAFYNADIVLTPHGANSTNCIYMREGTVFAEIFNPRWYKCINRHACEHLGIHYISEIGDPATKSTNPMDAINSDFTISEMRIRKIIEKAEKLLCGKE